MRALTPEEIRPRAGKAGPRIVCLDRCVSTNDEAWKLALDGAEDGSAVFAEEQEQGRGRFGRTWVSPRGSSLLASVILRPDIGVDRVPAVTAMAALAAADAIEEVSGLSPRIVFPNDLFVGGRKIAGILVESRFISSKPDLFVIGVGINVNVEPAQFPRELRETATSIRIERGAEANRATLARALLEALEEWVGELEGTLRRLRKAWTERSFILGRRVRVRENGKTFTGVVTQVDPLDGLELRLESGHARGVRGEHVEKLDVL